MTKMTCSFLIGLFVLASVGLSYSQPGFDGIAKTTVPGVVTILTYDEEGRISGQGSGFFVDHSGGIISNGHVFDGASSARVKCFDGRVYMVGGVVAANEAVDLIKVRADLPAGSYRWLNVSADSPAFGEKVLVLGSPKGMAYNSTEGTFSGYRKIFGRGGFLQISGQLYPGSSGSPVINTKGDVVGVASFEILEGKSLFLAIPGKRILELEEYKRIETISQWSNQQTARMVLAVENLYREGLLLFLAGDYEGALPLFEETAKKDPKNGMVWHQVGYCYYITGRYHAALEAYKRTIGLRTDDAEAHFNLGCAYAKLGRHREAQEAYKQALRFNPMYEKALFNLAVSYEEVGLYSEALKEYEQVTRLKSNDPEAHYRAGMLLAELDNIQGALAHYAILKKLNADLAMGLLQHIRR